MKKLITTIMLSVFPLFLFAQSNGKISGIVLDEEKQPLLGANIIVEGTSFGAATDMEGKYEFALPAGTYSITARFVGYEPVTKTNIVILAGKTTNLDFNLSSNAFTSGEVVVVGYGVQKKRDITGSVSSVNMKSLEKIPTTDVLQALQGQAAGVNVAQTDGAPGTSAFVRIRGVGTINSNAPLYIVDDVPSSIDLVNPSDIEAISVLKDAAAAAIYGARAANGVVLIKTKRGKSGNTKINFNTYTGFQSFNKFIDMTNSSEFISMVKTATKNAGGTDRQYVKMYEANPSQFANTDWQKEYYNKDGIQKKYELNVSGGSDTYNYSISGLLSENNGIAIKSSQKKANVRINSDAKLGWLKIGESVSILKDNVSRADGSDGMELLRYSPLISMYNSNNLGGFGGANTRIGMHDQFNQYAMSMLNDNDYEGIKINANAYASFDIIENLTYKLQGSYQVNDGYNYIYRAKYDAGPSEDNPTNQRTKAYLYESRDRNIYTSLVHTLNYSINIAEHSISALAGFSEETNNYRYLTGSKENFPNDIIRILNMGKENASANSATSTHNMRSYFGRLSYSYDDKYLAEFQIRKDGSTRFDIDKYGVFPSASVAWRVSKESFFQVPYVTDFKLRASIGKLGNSSIGDYQYFASLSSNTDQLNYVFGKDQIIFKGAAVTKFPALGITWEETQTKNLGFDLSMFDDRFSLSGEFYIKNTSKMLVEVPIPASTGASAAYANAGEIENKGIEFTATYRNFDSDFKYQITTNVSHNKNEILKLGYADEAIWAGNPYWDAGYTTKSVVGGEVGAFYLYRTAGIFQSDAEAAAYVKNGERIQPNAKAGDIKFIDVNDDGILNDDDKVYMGSALPDIEYSISLSCSYMNFDFTAMLYGVGGNKIYNATRYSVEGMDRHTNFAKSTLEAWTPENKNTSMPRAVMGDPNGNKRESDRWLEDGSFLRLKSIELGYTIPKTFLETVGLAKAGIRIYANATNLFTITPYKGYDPESLGGNLFARGVDTAVYPMAKTFLFGCQVNL